MQREHAQIMKITNVFFNPISAFTQTNLIIELKLTVYLFSKKLGGVMVFFETNILIPNVTEKNILILVEGKKICFRVFVI
jgi:hypothetical protein